MTLLEPSVHCLFPRVGKAMQALQALMFRRAQWQSIKTGPPADVQVIPPRSFLLLHDADWRTHVRTRLRAPSTLAHSRGRGAASVSGSLELEH